MRDRKARFAELNRLVASRGGFIVSVPGASEVTIEVLPNSSLPKELGQPGDGIRPADPPEGQQK